MQKKFWNLKRFVVGFIIAVAISIICWIVPQRAEEVEESIPQSVFCFQIPDEWRMFSEKEIYRFKPFFNSLVNEYLYNTMDEKISDYVALISPNKEIFFSAMAYTVNKNYTNYFSDRFEDCSNKLEKGLESEKIKKLVKNEYSKFKTFDCIITEIEIQSGDKIMTYLIRRDSVNNKFVLLGVLSKPNMYDDFKRDTERFLENFSINN